MAKIAIVIAPTTLPAMKVSTMTAVIIAPPS
jgi:hypothetical protein